MAKPEYAELMTLGKDEVERLCKLYDQEVITVPSHTNYNTGETIYEADVPKNAIPVHWFSNATHFLAITDEFKKLTPTQLEQLGSYLNDKFRPPFWAFED